MQRAANFFKVAPRLAGDAWEEAQIGTEHCRARAATGPQACRFDGYCQCFRRSRMALIEDGIDGSFAK
jgi:hypothetical protein